MPGKTNRCWQFTHFDILELQTIWDASKEDLDYLGGQVEKCPSTEKLHIQGIAIFTRKLGRKTVQKLLLSSMNDKKKYILHVEPLLTTSSILKKYSSKDETRQEDFKEFGTFSYVTNEKKHESFLQVYIDSVKSGKSKETLMIDFEGMYLKYNKQFNELYEKYRPMIFEDDIKEWRPWQKSIIDLVEEKPDPRKIIWIYDPIGNGGKSTLVNYLASVKGAYITEGGNHKDIAYAYDCQPIVCVDYVRDAKDYVNYGILEAFKNGRLSSHKYESKLKVFKRPHLIVFANFMPDKSKMSMDRWDIRQISFNLIDELE